MTELLKLTKLTEAFNRLKEGVSSAKNQLEIDGVLQRFEFTFELVWKTIQEYAKTQGIMVASPRESFRVAADLKLVSDVEEWFEYLEERNKTTHIYDAKMAQDIFSKIPRFVQMVEQLLSSLQRSSS